MNQFPKSNSNTNYLDSFSSNDASINNASINNINAQNDLEITAGLSGSGNVIFNTYGADANRSVVIQQANDTFTTGFYVVDSQNTNSISMGIFYNPTYGKYINAIGSQSIDPSTWVSLYLNPSGGVNGSQVICGIDASGYSSTYASTGLWVDNNIANGGNYIAVNGGYYVGTNQTKVIDNTGNLYGNSLTLTKQLTLSCGELYLSTSLSLSLTQNTYSLVGNTSGTSVWTAQNLNRFSNSTQYALTADWSNNNSLVDTIKLSANLSISSSVAGHTFQFVFYINATAISSSVKTITLNDTSTYIVDMSVSYPASYGNSFSIYVEDTTGSSTLTISAGNFQCFGTTPM